MLARPIAGGPRVVAIASGKGGVGKSLLAANLGIFLATLNKRVALIDLAIGNPSLHLFLGVRRPNRTLSETMDSRDVELEECFVETPIKNLWLVSGARDPAHAANPRSSQLTRLRSQVGKLEVDYVILDLSPGSAGSNLDFALLANTVILMLTPEPPATELAYRFARSLFIRKLRKASLGDAATFGPDELRGFEGGIPSPIDILRRVHGAGRVEEARVVEEAMLELRPALVLNDVRSKSDMDLGPAIGTAARRRLGLPVRYLGPLDHDDAVWVTLRRRRPLLIEHPESRISKCVERITRGLLGLELEPAPEAVSLEGDDFYALLGVEPTASDEEIRRANRRARDIYGRESLVVSGLYTPARLEELHARIDEAYQVIMDPRRRKAYDSQLFPEGPPDRLLNAIPEALPAESTVPEKRPPMPGIEEDTEFTGALMQQIRESQGIELRDIADKTKIGMAYLSAIEAEDWEKLPAPVYVRGFLVGYARTLRLDVERVLSTYLPRYREARAGAPAEADEPA
jgi:flagellar biosynthesis protein FlhG